MSLDGHEKRASLKKKAIEDAAFQLLNEGGIKDLKVRDIAKKAGTSPASIYNYYGSKEKLIVESMRNFYEGEYQKFIQLVNSEDDFIHQLHTSFLQKPKNTNMFKKEILEEILKENSELNGMVREYQQLIAPLFLQWIEKGRSQGYIKKDIPNDLIVMYYQLMSHSFEQLYQRIPEEQAGEETYKRLIEMFFYGFINDHS
jgi:AcrR family transcriptional regulator